MLHEGGYDIIELFSATKGMNQNTAPELLSPDFSTYINNIMPVSLGQGKVRYGTSDFANVQGNNISDRVIKFFDFTADNGAKQQVLYYNGYQNFATYTNFRITSSSTIVLTSPNIALFKPDTLLMLNYTDSFGLSSDSIYFIKNVAAFGDTPNTIQIQVDDNTFTDDLTDFYIQAVNPNPQRLSNTGFKITVPDDFIADIYYHAGQKLKLSIDGVVTDLIIDVDGVDDSVAGEIVFTVTTPTVPNFNDTNVRILSYESSTPQLSVLYNSYGYIKVLDVATKTILNGVNQTLSGLSVACVPRAEYFGKKLWICNGVDDVMTWGKANDSNEYELTIYEEQVKEEAKTFSKTAAKVFTFVTEPSFDITKYQNGKSIRLIIFRQKNLFADFTSVVTNITFDSATNIVQVTTFDNVPAFTAQDSCSLFYFDRLPKFSLMKAAHDRLWCLGAGAVGLEYRIPDLAMRFYYTYLPYSDAGGFKFFNEKTKSVPSEDISAKHGVADNLEAITQLSGNLVFIGRKSSQVWSGIDPVTQGSANFFSWSSTLPVGIYHGDLLVELPNDVGFFSQNGFVTFGTLNIARQFATSSTPNMDKIATEYMATIENNYQYRACCSFKYTGGKFCGFKIGQNDIIVSMFHSSFFWWGIFSGDFTAASCFLSRIDDCLYLIVGNHIYQYADGFAGSPVKYGDQDEARYINFSETKYVNNIRKRYANKRYEVQCDYSSSVVINPENVINIYISGNLPNTFSLDDQYELPVKGDLLGTINLVDGSKVATPDLPDYDALGMRLDSPSHPKTGRLKFVSNKFLVTLAGQLKNGPFVLNKIRFFGMVER